MAKCWGKRKRNCLLFGKILKKRVVTIYSTYMSVCGVQYRGWAGIYTYIVLDNIPDYSRDNLTEREVRTLPDIRQLFWRTSGELLISNL